MLALDPAPASIGRVVFYVSLHTYTKLEALASPPPTPLRPSEGAHSASIVSSFRAEQKASEPELV